MLWILLITVMLSSQVVADMYGDYPNYEDDGSAYEDDSSVQFSTASQSSEEDKMHRYNEDKTVNQIHLHHSALVALFGSDDVVLESVYRILHEVSFLRLAQVQIRINEAASDPIKMSRLNFTQQVEIKDVMELLDERMVELSAISGKSPLANELLNYSSGLLSVMSTSAVFDYLDAITSLVDRNLWSCSFGYFVNIWNDLQHCHHMSDFDHQKCRSHTHLDFEKASYSLVAITQAVNSATDHGGVFYDKGDASLENKAMLIHVLSESKNRKFVTKMLGSWRAVEDLVEYILCHRLSLIVLEDVLKKLSGGATDITDDQPQFKPAITASNDILALVEVQRVIGRVTKGLTTNKKERRLPGVGSTGNLFGVILDSYMNLVDDTVSSTDAWAQMSLQEAEKNLHQLLLSNEKYVGMVSDVMFSGPGHKPNFTLDKACISIDVYQMAIKENLPAAAEFHYEDMVIWTDDMSELRHENKSNAVTVFALRYKSWSHMMLDILLKHHAHMEMQPSNQSHLTTSSTTTTPSPPMESHEYDYMDGEEYFYPHLTRPLRSVDEENDLEARKPTFNKTFVGQGGVISLSAHQAGIKSSVPVTYWIKFSEENGNLSRVASGSTHRCFSCEYLDDDTIQWGTRGCHVLNISESGITCRCNHTTNFAAFMMPAEMTYATQAERKILEVMSTIGSILSVIGLILSLVVFALVRGLVRNERIKAHVHLSLSLLAVHLLYLLGDVFLRNNGSCVAATVVAHYALLAAFMWMLVEGIFLYLYVVQVFLRSKIASYSWMYFVGWLLPAIIVTISAGYGIPNNKYVMPKSPKPTVHCPAGAFLFSVEKDEDDVERNESSYDRCWLSTESGMIWSFLATALFVLVFNTFIMCKTLQVCIKSFKSASHLRALHKIVAKSANSSYAVAARNAPERSTEGPVNSDTYDHLHGQTYNRLPQDLNNREPRPQIVVSTSPCLLQVTTDEENEESGNMSPGPTHSPRLLSLPDQDAISPNRMSSSSENLRSGNYGRSRAASAESETNVLETSAFNRESMVYRNSACISLPKASLTSPMMNSAMANLAATERKLFFQEAKTAVKGTVVLLPVLGIPWICGMLSHLSPIFAFIFVTLNSTQGLAIFIVYCIFNGEVKRAMERRFAVRRMQYAVDAGVRRSSSTSTAPMRSFLRFGRRRSTVTTSV